MALPVDFIFSQNNLQDYVDCPRRFELRHLQRLEWPAVQTEPVQEQEQRMELGQRFHLMIQQYVVGIPSERIAAQALDPILQRWWQAFMEVQPLASLPGQRWAEYTLSMPLGGFRLLAKYDLLAVQPGERAVIMDWKTSFHRPSASTLRKRLQSRVYPFLLSQAGSRLNNNQPLSPDTISMIYWFPEAPGQPEQFDYSAAQAAADLDFLSGLIAAIQNTPAGGFELTAQEKACQFCNYRSLCARGAKAGSNPEEDSSGAPLSALDFDFDQIIEIEF